MSRVELDRTGVVPHLEPALVGESWSGGALILLWEDVKRDSQGNNPVAMQ
jgi:Mlc titration factor MtfA (ptsG expression regulator)